MGSPGRQCALSRRKQPLTSQHLLFQRRSHMASVKSPASHVRPSLLMTPPPHLHSQRPALRSRLSCPCAHSCIPPLPPDSPLALALSKLYFSTFFFFFATCAHPPFSLSLPLPALSVFFIIPPHSLIIFPDKLHSWTVSGLYSPTLPIIFCPFKMRPFSEKCARPRRIELPAAVICHRVINSKTPLLSWQLQIAGTQSV